MKISELIKSLEYSQKEVGDIPVVIRLGIGQGNTFVDDNIHFSHDEHENKPDELAIQNFPY